MKDYKIVNGFKDVYTGERYKKDTVVQFSEERVAEINTVEKVRNIKLIEVVEEEKEVNPEQEQTPNEGTEGQQEENTDQEQTPNEGTEGQQEENPKSNKKKK